jgi:hypothetical protein
VKKIALFHFCLLLFTFAFAFRLDRWASVAGLLLILNYLRLKPDLHVVGTPSPDWLERAAQNASGNRLLRVGI